MSTKYTAHFQPEVWVNDYALPVDALGEQQWDATAFLHSPPKGFEAYCKALMQEVADCDGCTDTGDVLRYDPAAPGWIREWTGPFTITVRETPEGGP